ncbi:MAG: hypothetical protein AAFN77_17720 [Planctomycetota bacterium]
MSREITTGQDSFLDIVANLVGILIILLVVVGAQASQSFEQTTESTDRPEEIKSLETDVSAAELSVEKLRRDNFDLQQQSLEQNQLAADMTVRRHQMLIELELLRQEKKDRENQLDSRMASWQDQDRERQVALASFEEKKRNLQRQIDDAKTTLNAVTAAYETPTVETKTETIDHYPNPIAKTVFDQEIHFRLSNGQLSFVPMDALIAEMKSEWKLKAEKLTNAPLTIETVGPIDGFRLQYELGAKTIEEPSEFGMLQRRSVQFQRFIIVPLPDAFSESVEVALSEGSKFRQRLSRLQAGNTTVSIWVYPDGFDDHAKIKTWLHENGYQMASWPLMTGRPISGGPQGFKTSAQ